ncbi:uncharacterized protein C8A04DRAFT_10165 [Dichotomopilus funicola]|uniref:Uncharacterized protein n=1 Tax=Dichotomopilus funicola TaxID=1934379 RepID=A0AAN6ZQ68_9PEZI|nr:hypothetical protein C8A04DRAFT_10165 [Dichotomopilus funicola]
MPPSQDQRYAPVPPIPTYDEAIAGGSSSHNNDDAAYYSHHQQQPTESEHQSLLTTSSRHAFESPSSTSSPAPSSAHAPLTGRRPRGYRAPTVETDDESSLFSSDDDSDSDSDDDREAEQVRREMQELEIDDSDVRGRHNRSLWGKRIGLSLPQWRWKWRLRMPNLRRSAGTGGSGSGNGSTGGGGGADAAAAPTSGQEDGSRSWFGLTRPPSLPAISNPAMFLLVGRTLAIFVVLGFLYLLISSDLFSNMAQRMGSRLFDPESVRAHVQGSVDARHIRDHLKHYTSYAHIAGTEGDFALMEDTEMLFEKYGLEGVRRDVFHVYLNYPLAGGRAVEILGEGGQATWSAQLEEEEAGERTAGHQTFAFHGHSKSGDVKGRLVYANYGTREDFKALQDKGINTNGVIALVRHHGPVEDVALKVKAAQDAGAVGCITYSDPVDDGFLKGEAAPKGRFMPADSVQRGSVSLLSWVVGDVLTPGWGSKDDLPRMKLEQTKGIVKIPSIPLPWRDAQGLLQHLQGFGEQVPKAWVGGVPDVDDWWTGNGSSPIVRLKNEQDEVVKQPIWNVHGQITGIEQGEKRVIIGNHRDSFAFGAVDPHSGTAIMLEIIRIFGDLVARGWRPLRTIEFASWDAAEYNLIGSTEFVEQNDDALREDALAYINLDKAVAGGDNSLHAAGSPVFHRLLLQILNRVADPHYNATLRDRWDHRQGEIEGLGRADSDYVAFQSIAGTSSLDLRFENDGASDADRLPLHRSSYENFEWMDNVGDPGFIYHSLLAQVVGLLVLELADRPVMPFDLPAYSDGLKRWVKTLEKWASSESLLESAKKAAGSISFDGLRQAANKDVPDAITRFIKWEASWESTVMASSGWEPAGLGRQRGEYNARMAAFESDLLDLAGIQGRTQFKHVAFGPQAWSRDSEAYFPGIRDAILSGNATLAQETVDKVTEVLTHASSNLIAQ